MPEFITVDRSKLKRCSRCNEKKSSIEFLTYKAKLVNGDTKEYLRSQCIQCQRDLQNIRDNAKRQERMESKGYNNMSISQKWWANHN